MLPVGQDQQNCWRRQSNLQHCFGKPEFRISLQYVGKNYRAPEEEGLR
jgi:hypothetical protein